MRLTFSFVTFTTSFATMCYTMTYISLASDFTGEEIISQCLMMGTYLLGLGIGSYQGDKFSAGKSLHTLWNLEWISVVLLPLLPMVQLVSIFIYLHLSPYVSDLQSSGPLFFVISLGMFCSFLSGILGGAQLPLILRLTKNTRPEIILALSYAGPLLAGPFLVFCSEFAIPISHQITSIGLIQLMGVLALTGLLSNKLLRIFCLVFSLVLVWSIQKVYPRIEFLTVKSSYVGTKFNFDSIQGLKNLINTIDGYGNLERVTTAYQRIDLFTYPPMIQFGQPENVTLFLNRHAQFDNYSTNVYHQSMVYGGLNLLDKIPENVLILGGGDGLLLKELVVFDQIKKITMVELDSGMLNWAKSHPYLSLLNNGSLSELDNRVELHVEDAITFLRKNEKLLKYDLVLIDFPFPNGHELLKLYSSEFYTLVRRSINQYSVVVIDVPITLEDDGVVSASNRVILKTLESSFKRTPLIYGPHAPFVALKMDRNAPAFNYLKFPKNLDLATKFNLVEILRIDDIDPQVWDSTPINSMFWPKGSE